ncbi:MAG: hypothetical protein ACRC6X_02495 [Culicoidibacterales bacterium]
MRKIKIASLSFSICLLFVGAIVIGINSSNKKEIINNTNDSIQDEIVNYDVNTATKTKFELYDETALQLTTGIHPQKLGNIFEITPTHESTKLSYQNLEEGDGSFCQGVTWQRYTIKNISQQPQTVTNELFYYEGVDGEEKILTNKLSNNRDGSYEFFLSPFIVTPGETQEFYLIAEHEFPGKRYPAGSTEEQRSAHRYVRAIFFQHPQMNESIAVADFSLNVSCSSVDAGEKTFSEG